MTNTYIYSLKAVLELRSYRSTARYLNHSESQCSLRLFLFEKYAVNSLFNSELSRTTSPWNYKIYFQLHDYFDFTAVCLLLYCTNTNGIHNDLFFLLDISDI